MALKKNRLNDRMYYTVEPCTETYNGSLVGIPDTGITRVSVYVDNSKMLIWDILLTEDTRYEVNLEVDPSFRYSDWIDLLASSEEGTLQEFSRPKAAWVNCAPIIVEQKNAIANLHRLMTARNIMCTDKVYFHAIGELGSIISDVMAIRSQE